MRAIGIHRHRMSKVDRAFLAKDGVRNAVRAAGHAHLLMPDEEVARSLAQTMASHPRGAPVWVFGYGSLMWNPLMEHAERQPARVHGWHRGFYVWSKVNRGTPEVPGLVLALDAGGSCHGIAYRLHETTLDEDLLLLWRREMVGGTYRPRWMKIDLGGQAVRAIAFIVDRTRPGYTGRLTDAQILEVARKAAGHYGSCADYLIRSAFSLEALGMPDRRLSRLARMLQRDSRSGD
jgi:glutathione-specific gamma-glutamylcyclotransferase